MNAFAGTRILVRLALRNDRIRMPVWILALTGLSVATAIAFDQMMADRREMAVFVQGVVDSPGLRALTGPPFDLSTVGGLTAWRITGIASVLAAVMSIFQVVRHTRAEEESGRAELVGAGSIGARAGLLASLIVVTASNLLLGLAIGVSFAALGLPVAGGFALGLGIAGCGLAFAAIAAVAAQIFSTARAAIGGSLAVLGAAYLLRAAGDVGDERLSWLSPVGWAQRARAYAGERWWTLAIPLATAIALTGLVFWLMRGRDTGAGMIPVRRGRERASRFLNGPTGLAWRLQRGVLFAWIIGFTVFGGVIGGLAATVEDLLLKNPRMRQFVELLGGSPDRFVDAFFATEIGVFGLVVAAFAVQAVLRARAEESLLRAEPVLAGHVRRWQWASGHLLIAVVGVALILASFGLATGIVHGIREGDPAGATRELVGAALSQAPAAWVLAGTTLLLFGAASRFGVAAWAFLGLCIATSIVGELLELPSWLVGISPFSHSPLAPAESVSPGTMVMLTLVAVLLAGAGLGLLRRRDIG